MEIIVKDFYTERARDEITGNRLNNGGVTDLIPYADSFFPVVTSGKRSEHAGTHADTVAKFDPANGAHPDDPIYWVGGTKVADDKADFTDGNWDDEANPKHADGTAATIDTGGYATGTLSTGKEQTRICFETNNIRHRMSIPNANKVHVGYLNDSNTNRTPLGPVNEDCDGVASAQFNPFYVLSGVFTVGSGTAIENAEAAEGSDVTFTVTIPNAAPAGGITVPYTFSDGLGIATDPAHTIATSADYTGTAGSVVIAEGQTSNTFTVSTTGDSTYEGDHYFRVILDTPTGTNAPPLAPGKGVGVGIITDDADAPMIAFSSATSSVGEGAGSVDITVTKTGTTLVPLSVYWTTADASAAHPGDYTAQSGYLEFAPDDTSKTITIPIMNDEDVESAEEFKIVLDEDLVVDAQVGSTDEITVTLTDDDGGGTNNAPTVANAIPDQAGLVGSSFSFTFAANTFNDADSDSLTYTATQSDSSPLPTWLMFDADARAFSGTPQPGDGGTLSVTVTADDGNSGTVTDTFDIVVTKLVSWTESDDTSLGNSQTLSEGTSLTIKVSVSDAPSSDLTIPMTIGTGGLTTAAAADYTVPTSVTISSGQTSATFNVEALIDEEREDVERFFLTLCPAGSCPSGYSSGAAPPQLTVLIGDPVIVVDASAITTHTSASHKVLPEGGSGEITVKLRQDPLVDTTVTIKPVAGSERYTQLLMSGTAASDYRGGYGSGHGRLPDHADIHGRQRRQLG